MQTVKADKGSCIKFLRFFMLHLEAFLLAASVDSTCDNIYLYTLTCLKYSYTWGACSHKCFGAEAFGSYALTINKCVFCQIIEYTCHSLVVHSLPYTAQHRCASISCCLHLLHLSCATGIVLTLNNVNYTNNSVVTITDIGTGSAALLCTTTYIPCCFSVPSPGTHWYFPDGSRAENTNTLPYYRTRTSTFISPSGAVLLHRNPEATTTGVFRCEILDASGIFQSLYVGIYTATTGESCTLKSNKFV